MAGGVRRQIDATLKRSGAEWGAHAQTRYAKLIFLAFDVIATDPGGSGSRQIERLNLWYFHIRSARLLVPPVERVRDPRHVVIYRFVPDGDVDILGLAHDQQDLIRAARRVRLAADR